MALGQELKASVGLEETIVQFLPPPCPDCYLRLPWDHSTLGLGMLEESFKAITVKSLFFSLSNERFIIAINPLF